MAVSTGNNIYSGDVWSFGIAATNTDTSNKAYINFHSNGAIEIWPKYTIIKGGWYLAISSDSIRLYHTNGNVVSTLATY